MRTNTLGPLGRAPTLQKGFCSGVETVLEIFSKISSHVVPIDQMSIIPLLFLFYIYFLHYSPSLYSLSFFFFPTPPSASSIRKASRSADRSPSSAIAALLAHRHSPLDRFRAAHSCSPPVRPVAAHLLRSRCRFLPHALSSCMAIVVPTTIVSSYTEQRCSKRG